MSKEKTVGTNAVVQELFHAGLYKRTQGRVTRQVTFAVLLVVFILAAWRLQVATTGANATVQYLLPAVLLLVGGWASYRAVNLPRFADFLIAVEAEMNKVSWPSKAELLRSSIVVIFVIFVLAVVLFGYDLLWQFLFQWLGIRR